MDNSLSLPNDFEVVEQNEQLPPIFTGLNALGSGNAAQSVAIDTEFMRTDTFYPILGLVQLRVDDSNFLIDPATISQFDSLKKAFADTSNRFVFHACGEDLEVLKCTFDIFPQHMFDTQIAAAFCGFGGQLGYQALLKEILQVDIPKGQTRSDWLRRPLSPEQLQYAALDVHYLLEIEDVLRQKLEQLGRLDWVEQECAAIVADVNSPDKAAGDYYLSLKTRKIFDQQQLYLLKHLAKWREEKCRQIDIPRSFLFKDATLVWLVERQPNSKSQLADAPGIKPKSVREYGEEILQVIQTVLNDSQAHTDHALVHPEAPLGREFNALSKSIKKLVNAQAEKLDMASEWLFRSRWLPALVNSYDQAIDSGDDWVVPNCLNAWRQELLLNDLQRCLEKHVDIIKNRSL